MARRLFSSRDVSHHVSNAFQSQFSADAAHRHTVSLVQNATKSVTASLDEHRRKAQMIYYSKKLAGVIESAQQHKSGCRRNNYCCCNIASGCEPVSSPLFSSLPTTQNYFGPEVTDEDVAKAQGLLESTSISDRPRKCRIDYASSAQRLKRHYQEKALARAKQFEVKPIVDVAFDDEGEDGCSAGAMRLKRIQKVLNMMGLDRSADQIRFHDAFTKACLPHIYGKNNWDGDSVAALEDIQIQRIQYEVLVQTARRMGKTVSVAMFVAAMLYCCPGIKICVFSTGQRASGSLMDQVIAFLRKLPGGEKRIISSNQEQLYVALNELPEGISGQSADGKRLKTDDTTSKLCSYPSTVTGKRVVHIHHRHSGIIYSNTTRNKQ